MSILVEIAEKADVPVEGVIRVLTREPVSDAVMERVLVVLDDLTPEQTRAVQRFALAALHDVLPRPLGSDRPPAEEEAADAEERPALPAPAASADQTLPAAPAASDAALVQLSGVLSELAEAVRDLRRETDEERRERVDDLAVLIDLITTGWQGLDARLGRIEKQISRLDSGRRQSAVPLPVLATPVPPAPPADVPFEGAPQPADEPPATAVEAERRSRLPLAAALTLAGAVIGTFAVLQLDSGGADVADLVSARDEPAQTSEGSSSTTGSGSGASSTGSATTTAGSTTRTRPPAASQPAPTTSSVLGTTVGKTQPRAKPPAAAPTTSATTTASKPPTPPSSPSFKPTRNWAWAPVPDADYYSVEFTRGGQSFYRATPTDPRLTLPGTLEFTPGSYRWIVRPGFGTRAAGRLGDPIVNSGFTVS